MNWRQLLVLLAGLALMLVLEIAFIGAVPFALGVLLWTVGGVLIGIGIVSVR